MHRFGLVSSFGVAHECRRPVMVMVPGIRARGCPWALTEMVRPYDREVDAGGTVMGAFRFETFLYSLSSRRPVHQT